MASSLRVLTYHRIGPPGRPGLSASRQTSATADGFERQMRHLARHYRVVSMAEVLEAQRGSRRLPRRAVLLTFDDGYRDFGEIAWPILQQLGLPATVFVPTAYPDDPSRSFWWDRIQHAMAHTARNDVSVPGLGTLDLSTALSRSASARRFTSLVKTTEHRMAMQLVDRLVEDLAAGAPPAADLLGWEALRRLAGQGISVAPHTRTHPALTRLGPEAVAAEIDGSIRDIEREIGFAPPAFCYPFGIHDEAVVQEVARQGIEVAFTCLDGHNRLPSRHPLLLRRTEVTRRTTPAIFGVRLTRVATYVDMWRHRHKYAAGDIVRPADDTVAPGHRRGEPGGRPKVAYIMSRFPKLSETFVLTEMAELDAMGVEVEVFPLLRERQPVSHPEAERWTRKARFQPFLSLPILRANLHFLARAPRAYLGVLVEVLRGTFGSPNFFLGALGIFPKSVRFAFEMQQLGIDHVHAHFANHPAVAALIVRRLTGIPFSFTAHGSDLHKDRRMLAAKVAAAEFAVTVSDFNREVMVEECGERSRSKIHVVHCGVDLDFFSPSEGPRDRAGFEIVCVASFEEVKGHRFLIDACRILRDREVAFRCHLIGDGPLRQDVAMQIDGANLGDQVVVHGGLPRAQVAARLASADAAVLASHPTREGKREGIPVALMEAMASALPVVATAITGIPELVEDGVTGILVPSGDPAPLANALHRLAADPALGIQMGRAGRAKVEREFSLHGTAERLLDLMGAQPRPEDRTGSVASASRQAAVAGGSREFTAGR